jgi:hypothetical protein
MMCGGGARDTRHTIHMLQCFTCRGPTLSLSSYILHSLLHPLFVVSSPQLHCPVPVPTPHLVSSTIFSLFHFYPSSLLFSTRFLHTVPTPALLNANPSPSMPPPHNYIVPCQCPPLRAYPSPLLFSTQFLHPVPTPRRQFSFYTVPYTSVRISFLNTTSSSRAHHCTPHHQPSD